jgi:HK97 family phage major capsid protein
MPTERDKLHELKRKQKQLKAEYKAICAKEADLPDGEEMPADDKTRLDDIERELTAMAGRIERLERVIELEADEAGDAGNGEGEDGERAAGGMTTRETRFAEAKAFYPDQKGWKAARFVIGCLHAKQYGFERAARYVEQNFGDKEVAKALNTAGTSTGGALIPQAFLPDLIELLRARVVIRELGPTIVPMPTGNLTIPRLAAGATAGYQGELDDIAVSQQTFDDLQLNAKKLTALVPVSNDLIRRAPIGVENIVRDDLVLSLARREDVAFLRGDGSGNSPIGLLNLAAGSNKLTVAAFAATDPTTILDTVVGVTNAMLLQAEQNMSRMLRPAWIFAPQIRFFLRGLRDQVGNFVFKDEIDRGQFLGIRYVTSQQLPTNLTTGSGANGTEIYLVDMADVVLGETYNVSVDASDVASYKDGGGNVVSAFQRDQTVFRVISEHDLNIRHQASIIVATVPAWAPNGYTGYGTGNAFFTQALTSDMSAAPSTWGVAAPTGSNNPGNSAAVVPGGTLPGRP